METLQIIWYVLVLVLLIGYAILDGFDLGVGFWHLFVKKDEERRLLLRSIGPFWDGNEVWLITGGGALFAAFPAVYASVFSGFYLALMLVLLALIFRAVAMEFRSLEEGSRWRKGWDFAFSVGSSLAALLFGVALGNLLNGMELDADGNYVAGFLALLNPFSLLIGLTGLAMLATQGALYLGFKTRGDVQARAQNWAKISWPVFLVLFILSSVLSFVWHPGHLSNYNAAPALWLIPVLALTAIVLTGWFTMRRNSFPAFLTNSLTIAASFMLVAAATFPSFVPATNPDLSLTLFNSSSSKLTLSWMLGITLLGFPFVLGYTFWIYRTFRGPVTLDDDDYGH